MKLYSVLIISLFLFICSLCVTSVKAEEAKAIPKLTKEQFKEITALIDTYFAADQENEQLKLLHRLRRKDCVNAKDFKSLTKYVWKLVKKLPKPEKASGTRKVKSPFGETQVIISGKANPKTGGVFLGLHGGGEGSGDGANAAGSFGGAKNCVSLFPTCIKKVDNAWNDPPQERFLVWLIKYIRRKAPSNTNKTYVVGHSMGGHGTYGQLFQYSDIYAAGFAGAGNPLVEDSADHYGDALKLATNLYNTPIYFAHSHDDPRVAIAPVLKWAEEMKKLRKAYPKGYEYVYSEEKDNDHNFPKEGVRFCLDWVTKHVRNPRPKKIRWVNYRSWKQHFYWMFAYQPEKLKLIEAEYTAPNVVKISAKKTISKISVLFNDKLVDMSKPVKVKCNGREVFNGMLKRYSISAMVAAIKEYEDPEYVYTARVDIEP